MFFVVENVVENIILYTKTNQSTCAGSDGMLSDRDA